jgi:hypothetical protein
VFVDTSAGDWRRHALDQAAGRGLLAPLVALALLALLLEAWLSRGVSAAPADHQASPAGTRRESGAPASRVA